MDKVKQTFQAHDPILFSLTEQYEISLPRQSTDPFLSLIDSIISQQLSVKAAATIFKRFLALFPNQKVTPAEILHIPLESLRSIGMSWSKASYVKNIAQAVTDKSLNLEHINEYTDEEIISQLIQVKGIGKWTAEMFLIFTLGREDVVSVTDVGLQNAIKKLYQLDHKPTTIEIESISMNWRPYRTFACLLLWKSLNNT